MKRSLLSILMFFFFFLGVMADTTVKMDKTDTPENVFLSFENAINNKNFQRAWNYWRTPPGNSYEKWANGYKNTKSMEIFYKYKDSDAGAGNRWVTYTVKVFAVNTDGKKHLYEGTYTLHTTNQELYDSIDKWPGWKIENGQLKKIY